MPQAQTNPFAAIVGGFGQAFAETHNKRIQQQLAVKANQNASIAETLVKSGMENPELWGNEVFKKAADGALGKDNAKAMAEVAMQFANSPMGVLKKAFGAQDLTRPDVPPEGPPLDLSQARPEAANAVISGRLAAQSPVETGVGLGTGLGQLQGTTQKLAQTTGKTDLGQDRLDLQRQNAARQQQNFETTTALKAQDVKGRAQDRNRRAALGRVEERTLETPTGDVLPYKVRVTANADGTNLVEQPITDVQLAKPPASVIDKFQGVNTGIRAASQLKDMLAGSPEEMAKILTPFVGDSIDNVAAKGGALSPKQRKFVALVKELRAQRSFALGGKNLTLNELQVFEGILPGLNESATTLPIIIQHAIDSLTQIGVDTENALHSTGYRSPPTIVTPNNKDLVRHLRRAVPSAPKASKVTTSGSASIQPESEIDSFQKILGE